MKFFYSLLALFLNLNCSFLENFVWQDEKIDQILKSSKVNIQQRTIKIGSNKIFFSESGIKNSNIILFIHGSPGRWSDYIQYLTDEELIKKYHIIAMDRLGYGNSQNSITTKLEIHAKAVISIADEYLKKKVLLIGHSYGGPVLIRSIMLDPNRFESGLLLAASIDPDLEKLRWFNYLCNLKLIRRILPSFIDVSNQEILVLKNELKKIENDWSKIFSKITIIHGEKDILVDVANVIYAEKKISHDNLKVIRLKEENHFLPWTQKELIKREIEKLIK